MSNACRAGMIAIVWTGGRNQYFTAGRPQPGPKWLAQPQQHQAKRYLPGNWQRTQISAKDRQHVSSTARANPVTRPPRRSAHWDASEPSETVLSHSPCSPYLRWNSHGPARTEWELALTALLTQRLQKVARKLRTRQKARRCHRIRSEKVIVTPHPNGWSHYPRPRRETRQAFFG